MDCVDFPRVLPNSPRKARGQIQVIFGPMFSGKSTELMRRVRRFQIAQYNCLVIKYAKDTRYSDVGMATHDENTMDAVPAACLGDVRFQALKACVIGIDEGQFFPDTVEFCEEMANLGKTVIVAALDGTFQRKPFGKILNLVPLAESVVKLHAVCMQCYKEAAYTKRLGAEKELEVIGGADKYQAVCRRCYGDLMADKENSAPIGNETPQHPLPGKLGDCGVHRKLFSSLHL
ncbi:thymidine kinase, cytosolic [Seriola dumerili]|uniref:Thymidine kinase n=1 Tax=Seriola dumerili TaxID=41447 RepID=A0A3B4T703_SERDU|nr:thymidine kinase, cytosolic [Seriola dumerili]XP_022611175.1 thymidine kinase, cytosolic [Seriola dumerili]